MENFNLLLHKKRVINIITKDSKTTYEIKSLSKKDKEKKEVGRKNELEDFKFQNIDWNELKQRQIDHVKLICSEISVPMELSPDYRLAVGLGNSSIYETSITLHHIYGFPYIPASAIKGVLRNFVINEFFQLSKEELKVTKKEDIGTKKEQKALKTSVEFCRIFGCPDKNARKNSEGKATSWIGDVIFFDSFPTQAPNIEMDIMTVHYPKYYGEGTQPPADWQNPNPIPFLTVKDNPKKNKYNKFQFIIGLRKGVKNDEIVLGDEKGTILSVASALLFEALTQHGIGAKTAIGYGYFQ
jgi:CRISPR-associated protein Cmr6